MKKLIATILTVVTLSALSMTAFATETTPQEGSGSSSAAQETSITAAMTQKEALEVALKDAGEKEADVTVSKYSVSNMETSDGGTITACTLAFKTDTSTYHYVLNADSGEILRKEYVYQNPSVTLKIQPHRGGRDGAGSRKHGKCNGRPGGQTTEEKPANSDSGASTD